MSKYERLLEPLSCLWKTDSGGPVCGERFLDMKLFTAHVRNQHIPQDPEEETGEGSQEILCGWSGCEQVVVGTFNKDYISHVLFHPYHCFLKLLGSEFQAKLKLPDCQYESLFSNVVQPLEVESRCLWDNGRCQLLFDDVWEFYSHVRNHIRTGEAGNRCLWEDCSFSGRDRNKVLEHSRTHLQEKLVACPTCGMRFSNNTKLKDHLNRQINPSRDPELTCNFCHKCFPNARLLREHTRRHINSIKCPHCDMTCPGPARLVQHIRYRHVSSKFHECPLCHKTYKTTQSLSAHIKAHGEYRIPCTWPNCTFLAKSEALLKGHRKAVHDNMEGEKLFCCHVCNTRYPQGRHLTAHLKKIHGFELPPGHCRFRYVLGKDGLKRLQTVRLDDENLYTPELNTFTASPNSKCSVTQSDQAADSDLDSEDNDILTDDRTETKGTNQDQDIEKSMHGAATFPITALMGLNRPPETFSNTGLASYAGNSSQTSPPNAMHGVVNVHVDSSGQSPMGFSAVQSHLDTASCAGVDDHSILASLASIAGDTSITNTGLIPNTYLSNTFSSITSGDTTAQDMNITTSFAGNTSLTSPSSFTAVGQATVSCTQSPNYTGSLDNTLNSFDFPHVSTSIVQGSFSDQSYTPNTVSSFDSSSFSTSFPNNNLVPASNVAMFNQASTPNLLTYPSAFPVGFSSGAVHQPDPSLSNWSTVDNTDESAPH